MLKWQLQKQASEALGRTVTVDQVDVRPWSLELQVTGLKVADAAGTAGIASPLQSSAREGGTSA